ncbi:MAG: hypothetical protein Q9218_004754 [Villophora microphyllina]
MPTLLNTTILLLIGLSGFGAYSTWYIFMNNGAGDMMKDIRNNGPHTLPYTDGAPLKKTYTGISVVDYQLTVLILFFYNVVDGSHPESSITLWGFAFQNADFAVVIPLYCAAHLATSPTVSPKRQRDFLLDHKKLTSIPWSIAIGLMVPTIAAALHAPSVVSHERKQSYMAIWQFFPVWVGLLQQIIPYLRSLLVDDAAAGKLSRTSISSMRKIYAILLTFAVFTRISTWTISISAALFPSIFSPETVGSLRPSAVFQPLSVSTSVKVPSIAVGSLQLLQYDEMVGAAAMVLWSTALYLNLTCKRSLGDWVSLIAKGIAIEALAGPQGFAVAALWARDETFFAEENNEKKDL